MNLDEIRARAERCEDARDSGDVLGWGVVAVESSADVPALIAEIERLRAALADAQDQTSRALDVAQRIKRERDAYATQVRRLADQLLSRAEQ